MLKRLWRGVSIATFAIAVAALSYTSEIASIGGSATIDQPLRETALHLPGVEPGTKVVAAALADIDADGDLDLIASDGTLDLLVWSNDGSGHFTRKYPGHAPGGGSLSRDGALDPGSGTLPASVVSDGGVSLAAGRRDYRARQSREWRARSVTSSLHSRALLTRASRAPPFTLRSA